MVNEEDLTFETNLSKKVDEFKQTESVFPKKNSWFIWL